MMFFSTGSLAQLEEVVVTATRMGETNLQDTPIAITAYTSGTLDRRVTSDLRDLAGLTPGLTLAENTTQAQVYIRGVGTNNVFAGSDPSSTIHVDGVYLSRPVSVLENFLDVERIEVLRGPQGTLYGRNSVGGTINIVSRKPSLEAAEAKLQLTAGNYDFARAEGYFSGPVVDDSLAMSISAQLSQRDGFRENVNPEAPDIDDEDLATFRAQALWKITENAQLVLRADYSEADFAPYGYHTFLERPPAAASLSQSIFGDYGKVAPGFPQRQDRENAGISADLDWRMGDHWTLKSITAYRDFEQTTENDSDASELNVLRLFLAEEQDQFSQEFHIIGSYDRFSALFGVYYFTEDLTYSAQNSINIIPSGISRRPQPEVSTDSRAVFGEINYDLAERWSLTLGGRFNDERKKFTKNDGLFLLTSTEPEIGTPPGPQIADLSFPTETGRFDDFTPNIGAQYRKSDNLLVYGSVKKGFKSGGFNFTAVVPGGFDPETLWAYELGVKASSQNGDFRLNAAAFYYDYEDLQVQSFVVPGQVDTTNAASADVAGFELELAAQLTGGISLGANLAYLDAEYSSYTEAPASGGGTADASGNRLNSAPEWSGAVFANFEKSFGARRLYARAEYTYQSEIFFTADNNPVDRQGGYGMLGLTAGVQFADGRYDLAIWGANLTDEEYITTSAQFTLVRAGRAGPPRTFGARFTWRY
jgi:iron complex outermembrane receptor protein